MSATGLLMVIAMALLIPSVVLCLWVALRLERGFHPRLIAIGVGLCLASGLLLVAAALTEAFS